MAIKDELCHIILPLSSLCIDQEVGNLVDLLLMSGVQCVEKDVGRMNEK